MEKSFQTTTSTVLMIRPCDFGYNPETAKDNEFMKQDQNTQKVLEESLKEFDNSVNLLCSKGINVIVFDKDLHPELKKEMMPDGVFPNNWISTENDGTITIYPMAAESRNKEKHAFRYVCELLMDQFQINKVKNLQLENYILEGTGALIIDRQLKRVYCSKSKRADKQLFELWCQQFGYEGILYEAISTNQLPYYHTNVILSIGDEFVVVCKECIKEKKDQDLIMQKLSEKRQIIEITREQVEKNFCGNILQLKVQNSEKKIIVMSETAEKGFTTEQKHQLTKYGEIVALSIPTIEKVGGGSARCMLAEIFLPRRNN